MTLPCYVILTSMNKIQAVTSSKKIDNTKRTRKKFSSNIMYPVTGPTHYVFNVNFPFKSRD